MLPHGQDYTGGICMKGNREVMRSLAMLTQVGLSMLAPVILCVFVGYFLDEKFGWYTTIPLLILGILAGARNSYLLIRQIQGRESDHDKKLDK